MAKTRGEYVTLLQEHDCWNSDWNLTKMTRDNMIKFINDHHECGEIEVCLIEHDAPETYGTMYTIHVSYFGILSLFTLKPPHCSGTLAIGFLKTDSLRLAFSFLNFFFFFRSSLFFFASCKICIGLLIFLFFIINKNAGV